MEKIIPGGQPLHIKGISCSVQNCVYHDGSNYCTADRINVGTSTANCTGDTICATFKPKGSIGVQG